MPEPRPQAIYTCSQSELYAICTIGWNSYSENQPDFEIFKTIYTAAFGSDALLEVQAAMNDLILVLKSLDLVLNELREY